MARTKNSLLGSPGVYTTVAVLAFAVFFGGLNDRPVPTIDGAVYASLARNIIDTGQWFPMSYQGRMFADHPPFFVWTIALSYKIFGVNDFAANLPMHLFAFLSILVTAMIARRAQLNRGVTLAVALTLCGTRDYVLTSVRGYIEPLFILCTYLGFWCILKQFSRRTPWWSFLAAVFVALAWFAKGPPALWPTVFFPLLLLWRRNTEHNRGASIGVFLSTIVAFAGLAAFLIHNFDTYGAFHHYFYKQVLGSALEGRGGQGHDPLYFANILFQYYWPWLPLLAFAAYSALKEIFFPEKPFEIPGISIELPSDLFPNPLPTWIFLIFALGFIGGFSIVKWKFWYYIAPAYPALALALGAGVYQKMAVFFEKPAFLKTVAAGALIWIAITSAFPVKTFRDRVPEVTAFRETIARSPIPGPVWFLHSSRDHNLIATSGEWSFAAREVRKVQTGEELTAQIKGTAWVITDEDSWTDCRQMQLSPRWCENADLIQTTPQSLLILRRD